MVRSSVGVWISLLLLGFTIPALAQQTAAVSAAVVPSMVNFSGTLTDLNGKPITSIAGVTFYLYKDSQGGAPLWMETQNVRPDRTGHYTVMLGSSNSHGLPAELFASGEARWLGVQVQGQAEQPRILLLSVPYALKAGDAATVGGLPPSAFVMAAPPLTSGKTGEASDAAVPATVPPPAVGGSGTGGQLSQWTGSGSSTTLGNSIITQVGSGSTAKIGINTTTPGVTLEVQGNSTLHGTTILARKALATASAGGKSYPLNLAASAFNSGSSSAVAQTFSWQAEPVGNNTATPSGSLNLLFASGSSTASETGLNFASNGQIHFAAGQTFPGTGTGSVTSVASGAGLTGGPITTSGTLSIASAAVTNAMLQHPSLTVTAGNGLSGGGAVALGASTTLSVNTSIVPTLAGVNDFTGYSLFAGSEPSYEVEVSNSSTGAAIRASNTSVNSGEPTLVLTNHDSTNAGDLVFDALGPSFSGECSIDVSGNLFCTGPLGTVASTPGNRKEGLYAVQSSENWVEDFGSGKLSGGVAKVQLEPRFGQAVTAANYHVFLTPGGDCQGLYITNRTATSFEVHELKGGKSNVEFDYRIVAHRRGFEAARLPDFTGRFTGREAPTPPQGRARTVAKK